MPSAVCGRFPSGGVLAFGSFGHGHGRSTLADEAFRLLEKAGVPARRLSTGALFRRMAEKRGFSDVLSFAQYLRTRPAEARRVDFTIDREVARALGSCRGHVIVLDSNLHAHPAVLRDVLKVRDFFTLYVHTPDGILGRRLVAGSRKGERKYSSWEDALRAQRKRTAADIARYAAHARSLRRGVLRELYSTGARIMAGLHVADVLFDDPTLLLRVARRLNRSTRLAIVDNSGSVKESIEQISAALTCEGTPWP